jgi:hypothetical protein
MGVCVGYVVIEAELDKSLPGIGSHAQRYWMTDSNRFWHLIALITVGVDVSLSMEEVEYERTFSNFTLRCREATTSTQSANDEPPSLESRQHLTEHSNTLPQY